MKTPLRNFFCNAMNQFLFCLGCCHVTLLLCLLAPTAANAAENQKTFATPEDALSALTAAASSNDLDALRVILGAASAEFENPDRVQAAHELSAFTNAVKQVSAIRHESDSRCVLVIGENRWPFPIPLVKKDGAWFFDSQAGKEELINRRIGRNELATLKVLRACVVAQREYASKDHDDDEVLEYAQRFISTPGTKDGLYWPPEQDGELSPLGPLVAHAQSIGYPENPQDPQSSPEPFHGYLFKILTRQGPHAPGGKYEYIINGNMIGGFAFLAWPASYGESGIMTFMVNQQGRVYQKDLGLQTASAAQKIKAYDPDKSWTVSPD